jgi:cytochrome c5
MSLRRSSNERPLAIANVASVAAAACFVLTASLAGAQAPERSGSEVVQSLCVSCHGTGERGAPKIGDKKAWTKLSKRGLTGLTKGALKGVRDMPPHGGNMALTDTEIERAITYMVNKSGGRWTESASRNPKSEARSGEWIVALRCGDCHQQGKMGAPRIGVKEDWIPRLKAGLDVVVRSAINGHGAMPPRGGMADLTDAEIKSAVVHMFSAPKPRASKGA